MSQDSVSTIILDRTIDNLNVDINKKYGTTQRAEQKVAVTDVRTKTLKVEDAINFSVPAKI